MAPIAASLLGHISDVFVEAEGDFHDGDVDAVAVTVGTSMMWTVMMGCSVTVTVAMSVVVHLDVLLKIICPALRENGA